MLRDITIGQYYQADSVLHRLDPRVKLVGTLVFIISLFLFKSFWGYAVVIAFFVLMVALSRVPFSYLARGLRPILIILILTAVLNLFWTQGTEIFHFGIITITQEGVRRSIFIVLRLMMLIMGASLMTLTTTPNSLTDGLERLLKPLAKIRVPVHELAMMMSIALRFIPILIEELDIIMKAQTARGADFESGNVVSRLRSMVPILVPLFVAAVRRAGDLALAMDARCYGGSARRTKLHPLHYGRRDAAAYLVLFIYLAALIAVVRGLPYV